MAYTNANTSAGPSSAAPPGLLPLLGARGKELAALLIFLSTAVMVAYQLATRQKVPDADNHRPKSTSSASSRKKRASDTLKDGGKFIWEGQVTPTRATEIPEPLKYRPFRWGPVYPINMGLVPVSWSDWLRLDTLFPRYHTLRRWRQRAMPENANLIKASPDGRHEHAFLELGQDIGHWLCTKYPDFFQLCYQDPHHPPHPSAEEGAALALRVLPAYLEAVRADPTVVRAGELKEEYDLTTPAGSLEMVASLNPDDTFLLMEDPERGNQYQLIGGSSCTAGFWRLKDKLGMTLEEIHVRGSVPQYKTKLQTPMDKYFARMTPDQLISRNNYFWQLSPKPNTVHAYDLASLPWGGAELPDATEINWGTLMNGREEYYDQTTKDTHDPSPPTRPAYDPMSISPTQHAAASPAEQHKFYEHLVMRTERQTLRRLPRSGAVIFTVRTYIVPFVTMLDEWGVPGRLASSMRSWPDDVRWYKGGDLYVEHVLPLLDAKHEEQLKQGLVVDKDAARKNYPF